MLLLTFILGLLSYHVQGWSQPQIKVGQEKLVSSEVVLDTGSHLSLTCVGDHPVKWKTRLAIQKQYSKTKGNSCIFTTKNATSEFTGTYKCVYTNTKALNFSSVHVFVRDPKVLFVASSSSLNIIKKEGDNALLPCLLTDPAATDIQLLLKNGTEPCPAMNVSFDPKKGMMIQGLHPGYNAEYICSGKTGGVNKVSSAFKLTVIPRIRTLPSVALNSNEYVRLIGEKLEIICSVFHSDSRYNITWAHSSNVELPRAGGESKIKNERLITESKLTLPAVDLSHSGNITCMGSNEAGVNSSTTHLLVIGEPYLRLSPKLTSQGLSINVREGSNVELRVIVEAYPPITNKQWEVPTFPNSSEPETSFISHNYRSEAVLYLRRLNSKEQGRYTFHANSSKANRSITFLIQIYQKPTVEVEKNNESSLTCTALGYPIPRIIWYQCQGTTPSCTENSTSSGAHQLATAHIFEMHRQDFGPVVVKSVIPIPHTNQKITVVCKAVNFIGEDSDTFPIDHSENLFTATLGGIIGMMVFLVLLLIILMYKYKQKPKYEIRWKIIEATDGNNYTFIDPSQLPYNEKWEFPRDKLKLGKILGSGAFGKVVEATAFGLGNYDNVTRVAVKMLKASAHSDEKEALMSELKILSHLGQHENIVNLLGACTYGGPVLVITEYCCHGDLLNFLRNKAETFLNCMVTIPSLEDISDYKNVTAEKKFVRSDSGISSTCSDSYLDMKPQAPRSTRTGRENDAVSSSGSQEQESWVLDIDDLLKFSYHVAQGLEFLAARNCIHRDVAARNVLLTDGRVAKICDFGLARDIMDDSNYVVKGNARLPVKWMAPESIFECVYTVQSDVWSYGILLWEIFSLGKSPYPNTSVDSKFYKMIKSGYQMPRPDFAPPEMYNIMKMCWNLEPTERPTFRTISQLIKRLLGDTPDQTMYQNVHSAVLDEEQLETCDSAKGNEESCEQEEEEQPLMKANNYQFC